MGVRPTSDELARLRARLLPGDPYAGFPIHEWPIDLQGWGSTHPLFGELIGVIRPAIIVEVGTWKGASAIHMARETKRLELSPVQIICVDTWLGTANTLLNRDDTFTALQHRHGYPQLYFQFLANVLHTGMDDMIAPLPQTSENAAVILRELGVRPDLVYVDGAHEGPAVRRDLESYFPLLCESGPAALMGDDFLRPEVAGAVYGYVADRGLALHAEGEKFVIARDAELIEQVATARSLWRRAVHRTRSVQHRLERRHHALGDQA